MKANSTAQFTGLPPWLWPHLLSLDAALIAVIWQMLLARSLRIHLNPLEPFVLGCAVWFVYLADHVADVLRHGSEVTVEPARKTFCRRYVRLLSAFAILLAAITLPVADTWLSKAMLRAGIALASLTGSYFAIVHLTPQRWRSLWPREIAVAAIYAAGSFSAVWLSEGRRLLPVAAPASLFALLCWANCSFIETWEWQKEGCSRDLAPSVSARWVTRHLNSLSISIAVFSFLLWAGSYLPAAFACSLILTSLVFCALGLVQTRLPGTWLSPCLEYALFTPLVVLPVLWAR